MMSSSAAVLVALSIDYLKQQGLASLEVSCRGRLQGLHAAQDQDGGLGQLHPFVRRPHSQAR